MPRDRHYETEDRSRYRKRKIPGQPDNPYPFSNVDRGSNPPPDNPSFPSGRGVRQPAPPPPPPRPPPTSPAPTSKNGSCKEPSQNKRRGDDQDPDGGHSPKRYVSEGWGTDTQTKNSAGTPTTESGSNQDGNHKRHYQSEFQMWDGYFPEEDSSYPEIYALGASGNSRNSRGFQFMEDPRDSIPRHRQYVPLPEMIDAATSNDFERNESPNENASSQRRQGRRRAAGSDSHTHQRYF